MSIGCCAMFNVLVSITELRNDRMSLCDIEHYAVWSFGNRNKYIKHRTTANSHLIFVHSVRDHPVQEGINQLSQNKAFVMVLAPVALTKMNCVE